MLLMEVVMVVCETSSLIWARQVQICFRISEGLSYLLNNMNDKLNVIHRDIKSANIDIKSANIDIKSANIIMDVVWNRKDHNIQFNLQHALQRNNPTSIKRCVVFTRASQIKEKEINSYQQERFETKTVGNASCDLFQSQGFKK
nr:probable receptor-like protein kinase At2g23200 [Tanacetum cinerariifolium]